MGHTGFNGSPPSSTFQNVCAPVVDNSWRDASPALLQLRRQQRQHADNVLPLWIVVRLALPLEFYRGQEIVLNLPDVRTHRALGSLLHFEEVGVAKNPMLAPMKTTRIIPA